jgi:acetoin utilization deacetylase AcuC-like enzyme
MIPVFYRPEMVVDNNDSYSESASKPKKVILDWQSNNKINNFIKVINFQPVSIETVKECHETKFVEDILSYKINNGFHNKIEEVAKSLLFTSGSLLAGAEYVIRYNGVAVSPTSGFHHASYSKAMGYCTFNGLMITSVEILKRLKENSKILILDFDMHYGNGTDDIIKKLNLTKKIHHISSQLSYNTAESALDRCSIEFLTKLIMEHRYSMIIYQAGADIHIDDPLGGLLTTEQMILRDRNIFQVCKETNTPLVWNLAGGYQKDQMGEITPVLELHRNTMIECIKQYAKDIK